MVDRLERLTDLVLVLLDGRPRSLRQIADEVPGYPAEGEARRQAFERDKRTLRRDGIELSTVPVPGPDQVGYLIRPEDFYLPDLHLDPEEQAALNLAVAAVHLGDPSGRDALWRLGVPAPTSARPLAQLPALPALPVLWEARRLRSEARFSYRGAPRRVAPAQLRFQGGWWYLVGWDLDKQAARTFRVDRMDDVPQAGPPGSGELPEGFEPSSALADEPWRMGDGEPVPVDLLAGSAVAPLLERQLQSATVVERRPDGSVVLRLQVTNVDALRSWLFELGDHVLVLGPPEVRAAMVDWLESMVSHTGGAPSSGGKRRGRAA
ncbi:MAG TPA: WYL domain-containing protein [Acidimicrobiales bacterium]|nr:WYL domain-containing protein [Acidimicrobiales bacterium]